MEPELNFISFVRKPFEIEALQITDDNIEAVAPMIGDLETGEDGRAFIKVNRRLVPNIYRVFPGFWVTKMGDNVRCYADKIFVEQFVEKTEDVGEIAAQLQSSVS